MENFRKSLLGLDWIVKVILVVVYNIYGILYRLTKGDTKGIVVAILMLVIPPFNFVMWILDIIAVIVNKGEPTFLA